MRACRRRRCRDLAFGSRCTRTGALSGGALLAIGLSNLIMFPTIFALASGRRVHEGSGINWGHDHRDHALRERGMEYAPASRAHLVGA
jgi:hypothetical protein